MCVCVCVCAVTHSCLTLCNPVDYSPSRLPCSWYFPDKNTAVGCHFFLQGIFPIQGSNSHPLHLLHWRVDSSHCVTRTHPYCSHFLRDYKISVTCGPWLNHSFRNIGDNLDLQVACKVGAVLWIWAAHLWDLMLSPRRQCQNWVKFVGYPVSLC